MSITLTRYLIEEKRAGRMVEQAGGAATNRRTRILDVAPAHLYQRVPVLLGSRREVEQATRDHIEHDARTGPH